MMARSALHTGKIITFLVPVIIIINFLFLLKDATTGGLHHCTCTCMGFILHTKRNVLWHYYINWSLAMLLGMYSIIGYYMAIPSLLAYVTTSPETPCGTPGLGDSETIYSLASGAFNGGSMTGAIMVAVLTKRISYKAIMLIGPASQVLGYCIYGSSVAGWMVAVGRGFAGFNYGASLAVAMSYYSVSSVEYNELAASLSKPEKPNIRKALMIGHFTVIAIGYFISAGLASLVEQLFEYPQIDTFRWIAWFEVATGCVIITLQCVLFHNTDKCLQCGDKPEAPEDEDYKEVIKPSLTLADKMIIVYVLFAGAIIDCTVIIVDTVAAILLTDYFGFTVKYISYFFLGASQIYHLPAWTLLLLNKCKVKAMVILFASLALATTAFMILIDWPYLYSSDTCTGYSIDEPVQLATSSHSTCDISSLCYPLDISHHSLPFYLVLRNSSSNDSTVYSVTYEHVCRATASDITNISFYISCTDQDMNLTDACKCNESINYAGFSNDTFCVTAANDARNTCGEYWPLQHSLTRSAILDVLFQSTNGEKEYNDTSVGIEYIDRIASKQTQCELDRNCYWNPDSVVTGEYCFNCPTLCRLSNGLHFSQVVVAVVVLQFASEIGRNMLFPIMSKLSPKHVRPVTTSILIFVQDLSRLVTPLWAVEVYLSSGRHTYPVMGAAIVLQLPVYVGFVVLNCYLHHKKRKKEKVRKQRPSIVELLPASQPDRDTIEGHTNKIVLEASDNDDIDIIVTPL